MNGSNSKSSTQQIIEKFVFDSKSSIQLIIEKFEVIHLKPCTVGSPSVDILKSLFYNHFT